MQIHVLLKFYIKIITVVISKSSIKADNFKVVGPGSIYYVISKSIIQMDSVHDLDKYFM